MPRNPVPLTRRITPPSMLDATDENTAGLRHDQTSTARPRFSEQPDQSGGWQKPRESRLSTSIPGWSAPWTLWGGGGGGKVATQPPPSQGPQVGGNGGPKVWAKRHYPVPRRRGCLTPESRGQKRGCAPVPSLTQRWT